MITNFFAETHELNKYESEVLQPLIVAGLKTKIGKEKAITNKQICKALKDREHKITDSRLRKIIHNIRAKDLVPLLIATSRGYYVATDNQEIEDYIKSLEERANSILFIKNCLKKQFKKEKYRQLMNGQRNFGHRNTNDFEQLNLGL